MSAITKVNPFARPALWAGEDIFYPETDGQPMAESDLHRDLILELIDTLKNFFAEREDVYVTGNILVYYTEGVIEDSFAPDVMVIFGVPNHQRRSYFVWKEQPPTVIIEIASRSTWKVDRVDKRLLYEMLGVREYFIFNPEYPKRNPAFMAFRLSDKDILEPLDIENGRVFSEELGLEIVDTGGSLRLFNPATKSFLQTRSELRREAREAEQRAKKAAQQAKKAEQRAVNAESQNSELLARIAELEARLKKQD